MREREVGTRRMREELNKSKSRGEWTDTGDLARELPALAGRRPGAEACKEAGWTLEVGLCRCGSAQLD